MKKFIPLLILIATIGAVYASGLQSYFTFSALQNQKDFLNTLAATHPVLFPVGFMLAYAACVALSLPVATLLTLLGGFVFGSWAGTAYVAIGATTGATVIFLIAKSALGSSLRQSAGNFYKKIASEMTENATSYLLFMRLVPIFPFALVNIVPALFNVKLSTYFLTTFFGILPGTFVYVNLGGTLAEIKSLNDLATPQTAVAFSLLGVFALVPTIIKKIRRRK